MLLLNLPIFLTIVEINCREELKLTANMRLNQNSRNTEKITEFTY